LNELVGISGYVLTAGIAGGAGYYLAGIRAAPRMAELARRVDVAERCLYRQGQDMRELSQALRGLLAELERLPRDPSRSAAVLAARTALADR
jgi:hypothetical protein